jgi:hypothetical protein
MKVAKRLTKFLSPVGERLGEGALAMGKAESA